MLVNMAARALSCWCRYVHLSGSTSLAPPLSSHACLLLLLIVMQANNYNVVSMYNFGDPRVGNPEFAAVRHDSTTTATTHHRLASTLFSHTPSLVAAGRPLVQTWALTRHTVWCTTKTLCHTCRQSCWAFTTLPQRCAATPAHKYRSQASS